jgi:hypothetical protein
MRRPPTVLALAALGSRIDVSAREEENFGPEGQYGAAELRGLSFVGKAICARGEGFQ